MIVFFYVRGGDDRHNWDMHCYKHIVHPYLFPFHFAIKKYLITLELCNIVDVQIVLGTYVGSMSISAQNPIGTSKQTINNSACRFGFNILNCRCYL